MAKNRTKYHNLGKIWYKFCQNKLSLMGLIIVVLFIISAIIAPIIAPYTEHVGVFTDFSNANKSPSSQYIFGTDIMGRDVFSRILFLCVQRY